MFLDLHRGVLEEFASMASWGRYDVSDLNTLFVATSGTGALKINAPGHAARLRVWRRANAESHRAERGRAYKALRADPVRYAAKLKRDRDARAARKARLQ